VNANYFVSGKSSESFFQSSLKKTNLNIHIKVQEFEILGVKIPEVGRNLYLFYQCQERVQHEN